MPDAIYSNMISISCRCLAWGVRLTNYHYRISTRAQQQNHGERSAAASVYKLKGRYLRLNTPLFPVHFRAARAAPDIAFKVAPHANVRTRPAPIIRYTPRYPPRWHTPQALNNSSTLRRTPRCQTTQTSQMYMLNYLLISNCATINHIHLF